MLAESRINDVKETGDFRNAISTNFQKEWKRTMDDETKSHGMNKTWRLQPFPAGKKCITRKWVYKIKKNPQRSIDRFKTGLVIKKILATQRGKIF